MFKLIIQAPTMAKLKDQLFEAYESIDDDEMIEDNPPRVHVEQGYVEQVAHAPNPIFNDIPYVRAAPTPQPTAVPHFPSDDTRPVVAVGSSATHDNRGIPWDARVHSSSHQINTDGSWRTRRNVDKGVLMRVEDELRRSAGSQQSPAGNQQLHAPGHPVFPGQTNQYPQVPASTIPSVPPQAPVQAPPVITQPVVAPQVAQTPPPQGVTSAHTLDTFRAKFIPTMVNLITSGRIDQAYVEQLKNHFKVAEIYDCAKSDAQISEIYDIFCQYGLVQRV